MSNFDTWLKRHTEFSDYQIRRLSKFRDSDRAVAICDAHVWCL